MTYQLVLTKADDVKPTALQRMRAEVAGLIGRHAAAYPDIIATSSNTGAGIAELRAVLATLAA